MKDSFRNSCNVLCLIIRSEKWSDQFSRHIISFPEEGGGNSVRKGGGGGEENEEVVQGEVMHHHTWNA